MAQEFFLELDEIGVPPTFDILGQPNKFWVRYDNKRSNFWLQMLFSSKNIFNLAGLRISTLNKNSISLHTFRFSSSVGNIKKIVWHIYLQAAEGILKLCDVTLIA